jgi:TonB-linked SusC/RagA family outer membrane protein
MFMVQSIARTVRRGAVLAGVFVALGAGGGLATLQAQTPAQAGTITGTVVESKTGRPLVTATVRVDGTQLGANTDNRGQFTIRGATGATVRITATRVGYQPRSVDAKTDGTPVQIALEELVVKLDELVVTGTAGEQTTRTLGNAVAKVAIAANVEIAPPAKFQDLLSVNVPGVRVLRAAGSIGSGGVTRVRGVGSLSLSSEPLIYIDGVRVNNDPAVVTEAFQRFSGESPSRVNDINPEEIESIEVIKGPSAGTIYGTEASNGVIQIITKRGRQGRNQVEVHTGIGRTWLENPKTRFQTNFYQNLGTDGLPDGTVTEFNVQEFNESKGFPPIFTYGYPKSAGASLSGGTERLTYFFSADADRDEGYLTYNSQNKYNARANITYRTADDKFKIDGSLGTLRLHLNSSQGFQPITTSIVWACPNNACRPDPADPEHTGFNGPSRGFTFYRPEDYSEVAAFDNVDRITFSFTLTHRPFPWLRHHLTVGPDFTNNNSSNLVDRHFDERRPFFSSSDGAKTVSELRTTFMSVDYGISADWKPMKDLVLSTAAGAQYYYKQNSYQLGQGLIFAIPGPGDITGAQQRLASESFNENKTFGVFAQEQIGWKNRRFLTVALRGDGNSAFGKDFSAVYYPKLSASWVLSEESGFAGKDWLPQLKLRAAWGKAGQQPDVFSAIQTYQARVGAGGRGMVTPQNIGNVGLKPEVGQEFEVGFDAGLLKGRAGIEFTYYNKKVKDAILSVPLKPSRGYPGFQFVNIGETQNKGVELALDGAVLNGKNLGLDARFTFARNNPKITSLGGLAPTLVSFAQQYNVEGFAPGGFYLKKVVSSTVVKPHGEIPYGTNVMCEGGTDLGAGNGSVVPCDNAPRIYAGQPTPLWSGSGSLTLTVQRHLRLLGVVDYAGGHRADVGDVGFGAMFFNLTKAVLTGEDEILSGYFGLLKQGYGGAGDAAGFFNAGFARLRTVSASYDMPDRFAHWVGASRGSVTLSGENLAFLWRAQVNSYGVPWVDPEIRPNFAGDATQLNGYVQESFPQATRVRLSLRFTF